MELGQLSEQVRMDALPHGWQDYTIGQTLTLINGLAFRPGEWKAHGIPIIRIQNLNDDNSPYNYYDGPISEKYRIRAGDILFAWSGTTGTSFGARIWTGPNAVLNQHIFKVTPDKTKVTPYYSFLVLQNVQKEIERQAHGFKSSFVHVKKSDLVKVSLPIPPIPEQRAIGEALSEIDQLIANLGRLVEKKRVIKHGMMQELLTGKTRLPGFTEPWSAGIFEQLAVPSRERAMPRDVPPTTPLVELEQVESGSGRLVGKSQAADAISLKAVFRPGDVLFGKLRAYLRKFWFADVAGLCTTEIWVLRARPGVDSRFVRSIVETERFIEAASGAYGTHMPRSDWGTVRSLSVDIPPHDEQRAIASVLADIDREISILHARLAKARDVKQGMMQQLLTGRTRLPVQESAA
ncbi:restriction endonuclease subunit S [Streptomyces scabiei]|uniref:restriction endonuclease subunit S n=1 Tax=Streptomyces scabiei TaxID=1930 RepID=UPI000997FE49|nr:MULTISPECIES: restriction endonuclease subunit S [Streptomyces]MBP5867924.1 restriction endonuclease subunit S [Streptomyces sp. LBUM 1485]MBP5916266.1 restriction endonuclease subunit S [Streptomyces sp. LBUM 1486]MDX2540137.1 restriction endonuclease subunit S [Streptomyces scabiei]MDX2802554.1 restriction endonuclease subunit S [Streptomyces scabiei]MDX2856841.1 restriction endonuclease subunit S [Streptomyces scabiei]